MVERIRFRELSPQFLKALLAADAELTSLDARLKSLVEFRASQINRCAYCIDLHRTQAIQAGLTDAELHLLPAWREMTTLFDKRERAALEWCEALTHLVTNSVPDELYERVRHHIADKELVELTYAVAAINAWNRIAVSLRQLPTVPVTARG